VKNRFSKQYLHKMKKLFKIIRKQVLSTILPGGFYFSHKGYCPCCSKDVNFVSFNHWLRDNFYCSNCFSIPRERALMITIEKYFPKWRTLNIHESSPGNRGASFTLKNNCEKYISTQYYPNLTLGTFKNKHRNEDLENQTFKDETFDLVITQDVMEHVYNPEKAFREITRTLKNGGAHIFTVPIVNKYNMTEVWATKGEDGEPVFLKTPEFHGSPINSKGSPVTMHWGFDIIDFIRNKSGLDTKIEYIDNIDFGIRAEFIEVLVSIKK